jgi:hypothetical protein
LPLAIRCVRPGPGEQADDDRKQENTDPDQIAERHGDRLRDVVGRSLAVPFAASVEERREVVRVVAVRVGKDVRVGDSAEAQLVQARYATRLSLAGIELILGRRLFQP